ncbi:MAG: hypothetical protein PHE10_09910 [Kiritimatiellae bacterium]|nr:hypothetical protein [Kiritimatiellia bacterium]
MCVIYDLFVNPPRESSGFPFFRHLYGKTVQGVLTVSSLQLLESVCQG